MTTLATRVRVLSDLEGFDIEVLNKDGSIADLKTNGLPAYPYEKKAKSSINVADWKSRFHKTYPSYTCEVFDANGNIAHGNTKLEKVRESYEE
ncbi:hypothetical protein [Jeongeupia naejangsanensis]|uniref:Uncharacterized protein n=1 Tax=Jeongeupia naejangsanensis TaxID=613195 RepID=A0ABS2BFA8_9NEIS|nr:hypothetical protein [Jeongeupia naejangsanensis]MBM3114288.1 hypothetical protein [Jeongeupia naejangsanensis]